MWPLSPARLTRKKLLPGGGKVRRANLPEFGAKVDKNRLQDVAKTKSCESAHPAQGSRSFGAPKTRKEGPGVEKNPISQRPGNGQFE